MAVYRSWDPFNGSVQVLGPLNSSVQVLGPLNVQVLGPLNVQVLGPLNVQVLGPLYPIWALAPHHSALLFELPRGNYS